MQVPVSENPQAERPAYDRSLPTTEAIPTDYAGLLLHHLTRYHDPTTPEPLRIFHQNQLVALHKRPPEAFEWRTFCYQAKQALYRYRHNARARARPHLT